MLYIIRNSYKKIEGSWHMCFADKGTFWRMVGALFKPTNKPKPIKVGHI